MAKKFCYDQLQQVAGLGSPNCTKLGDARCIIYTGANLTCTGILTNDTLDVIIKKLSDFICDCCSGGTGGGGSITCIQAGDNVTITGLGTEANCYTISVSNENIQDVVGLMFLDTPTVDFTYNDAAGQVSADVIVNGINEAVDNIVVWDGTQFFLRDINGISKPIIQNFFVSNFYTASTDCLDIPTVHPTQVIMHVGTGLDYQPGDTITIFADSEHYFTATVVSYDSTTGILVMNTISNVGTGNFCNWTVNLSALFGLSTVITQDTVTLDLTGDGTLANPLFGDVNISQFANNEIIVLPDGLWAPGSRNGLIYGGIVTWTGVGYVYDISPAGYYINGVFYTSPGTTVTLDPADSTFDRIDMFIVDNTGTASVLTGTPSDNPQEPPIDPATQLRLSIALVQVGSTTPVGAVIDCLYKEDVEWTTAVNTSRINVTSTSNPFEGTLDIEGTNTITGDRVTFTRPGGPFIPIPTYTTLSFKLRVKSDWNINKRKLTLQWYLGGVAEGNPVDVFNGVYGLITSNTSTYQIITIPLSDFGLNNLITVDNLRITVNTNSAIGWYIDNICISNAAASPVGLPLILNNGLNLNYATNTGQLGGTLLHNTTNDTASFIHTFRGEPVYDFPYQFFQNQYFPTGTGIVSFKNHGDYSSIDGTPHPISAKLGINYTGNVYLYSPSFPTVSIPGYFNDRIGYWEGVNATGDGSFGFKVDDSNSKVTGIFFHTEDNTYTDGVSIYAVPSGLDSGSPNFVLNRAELYNHRTVVFHTDRSNEFLGKTYMNQVRFEEAKGVNVASTGDLTLGNDGNLFVISGTNTVNAITTLNWQAGSKIEFIFSGTATLKHNTAGGAGTAPFKLAGSADFTAAVDDAILLAYDGSFWHEIGRKLASIGGATVSADNGLHISSLDNVRLGGTLVENTTITQNGNIFAVQNGVGDFTLRLNPASGVYQIGDISNAGNNTWINIDDNTSKIILTNAINFASYGIGTYTGTPTYTLLVDASGNVIEGPVAITGITADDGLTTNTATNVRLFGTIGSPATLLDDRYLDAGLFKLNITGAVGNPNYIFNVTNTSTFGNGIRGVTDVGIAIEGFSTGGYGVHGSSTNGPGGAFESINTNGVQAKSTNNAAGVFTVLPASTNTVVPVVALYRISSGTPSNGIGGSLEFYNESDSTDQRLSNQIISKLTTAADLTRTSQLVITGVNNAVTVDKLYIGSAAIQANAIRFEEYRGADVNSANDLTVGVDGNTFAILGTTQINAITRADWQAGSRIHLIFSGALTVKNNTVGGAGTDPILLAGGADFTTSTNDVLTLVYSGSFWHETARKLASSGGAGVTADNGLHINTLNNVRLGGTLVENTTVNIAGFTTTWQGTLDAGTMFFMNNTGTTGNNALNAQSNGSGIGVQGSSVSGLGVWGISSSNYGVYASSTTGTALGANVNPASTNTIVNVQTLERKTSGTPSAGIGGALQFQVQDLSGASSMTTKFASKWTDPTFATRTSQLDVIGANSGSDNTIASFYGSGVVGIGISSAYTATRLEVVDNSVGAASIMKVTSTSTAANTNLQKGVEVLLSGTNSNSGQTTYAIYGSNTHAGTVPSNTGVYGTANGGTTNRGVYGVGGNSAGTFGVYGESQSSNGTGVYGTCNGGASARGVVGASADGGSIPVSAQVTTTSTNDIYTGVEIMRQTSGTAATGLGISVEYDLESSTGSVRKSNSIISKWTDATDATRMSQLDIVGINSSADNLIMSAYGTGVVGIGISSGYVASRLEIVDNAAANSIVKVSTNSTTAVSQKGIEVSLQGANATSSLNTYGVYAVNNHTGTSSTNQGVTGIADNASINYGVAGLTSSSSGAGVSGSSLGAAEGVRGTNNSTGIGVLGISVDGVSLSGQRTTSSTNTVLTVLQVVRNCSTPASTTAGIGSSVDFYTGTTGISEISNQIISKWTDAAHATRSSQFEIWGVNSASSAQYLTLKAGGQLQLNTYGAGTLTTDASGNVTATSDEKLKDIQGMYEGGTEVLMNVIPIEYKWNEEAGFDREHTYIGFSAQNIQKALGDKAVGHGTNGYLTLQDRAIMATLVNAVKEQQKEIEELKKLIKGLLNG